jgi:hypothetical protein
MRNEIAEGDDQRDSGQLPDRRLTGNESQATDQAADQDHEQTAATALDRLRRAAIDHCDDGHD